MAYHAFNRDTRGRLRYTSFRFIRATRCLSCERPILFPIVQGVLPKIVAIDHSSWDGSSYYIKGKHKPHSRSCPGFMSKLAEYRALKEADLVVEG